MTAKDIAIRCIPSLIKVFVIEKFQYHLDQSGTSLVAAPNSR